MIKKLEPKHLEMTTALLEFLASEEDKRLTRLEAFVDLLLMATRYEGHVCRYGQEFHLVPGEIVTSISELASKWKWQRATVRKFVDSLVELGQIVHNPQVKCSLVEVICLRFKWLPSDHPLNFMTKASFGGKDVPLAECDEMTTSIIDEMSGHFKANATDMTDTEGNILYTAEQRCQVAALFLQAMMVAYRHLVVDVYTPEAEKSLLDIFFKICHGSEKNAVALINALFDDDAHNVNLMVWETYGDTRDAVTRIFAQAFRELASCLPADVRLTDSKDKPSETVSLEKGAKSKPLGDDGI
mgnify:CR=1 FL=1